MTIQTPDRIYAQYRNSPKTVQWLNIVDTIADELCVAVNDVQLMYDIDLNIGEQLNIIGRIIGTDRTVLGSFILEVFEANTDGDNECGDPAVQCSAASVAGDSELSDTYFRTLIRSKIVKNNSFSTIDGILKAVSFVTPNTLWSKLNDHEDMTFSLETSDTLTEIERTLLVTEDVVPKPQGVRFLGFLELNNLAQCNNEGLFECGDPLNECVGFIGGS